MSDRLIETVKLGNIQQVRKYLALGDDPNARCGWVSGPVLETAIALGHTEIAKALVEAGADPNGADCEGGSVLMVACDEGNVEMVDFLLAAGADVNSATKDGTTALMCAVLAEEDEENEISGSLDILERLLSAGADPNAVDKNDMTALEQAASGGNVAILHRLLEVTDTTIERLNWAIYSADNSGCSEIAEGLKDEIVRRGGKIRNFAADFQQQLLINARTKIDITTFDRASISNFFLQTFSFATVQVNKKGETVREILGETKYFFENLGNGISLKMVKIPSGNFLMGSPEDEEGYHDSQRPQHQVHIPSFYLGKYPVTQEQWQSVMGYNPSYHKGQERPVEGVFWHEMEHFCQRLLEKTGREYRLPSEAEWEYACRAGTTTAFYFGPTLTTEIANYDGYNAYGYGLKGKCREQTTKVGSFPPNYFGLYDMHGNVFECCSDYWHDNYKGAPSNGSAWLNGDINPSRLVMRGGSWATAATSCRSASRIRFNPNRRSSDGVGFRVSCMIINETA